MNLTMEWQVLSSNFVTKIAKSTRYRLPKWERKEHDINMYKIMVTTGRIDLSTQVGYLTLENIIMYV